VNDQTDVLIIGAGPYGLSLAASVQHAGLDFKVLGKPLVFWKDNMPDGMMLRSGTDWHLDPQEKSTFKAFVEKENLSEDDLTPLPIGVFLDYAAWFQAEKNLPVQENLVKKLDVQEHLFHALLDNGQTLIAKRVVLALGFSGFENLPENLTAMLPEGKYDHTATLVDFASLRDKRCLIIGGRQSALEWAALIHEQGAREVHVSHRHDTPVLKPSDWSWVPSLVRRTVADSGWFRKQTEVEKEALAQRFWEEGRLKLEPWLAKRLDQPSIRFWPNTELTKVETDASETMTITLNHDQELDIDHVVLATGYRMDVNKMPFLASGNCLAEIETRNDFPVLDEYFQSSLKDLFFTSFAATQDFGPFFGFTVGCTSASKALGKYLLDTQIDPTLRATIA